jgi:hypothetical protein
VKGDQLLQSVVSDGNVDYDKIEQDALDASLEEIAAADLATMSAKEQYAFLINAYNICVLDVAKRVLTGGKSLNNKITWLRFFLFSKVRVAGLNLSLYNLEFKLIKPFLELDPRGHFALVCASNGCPPLREGVYHAATLDAELDLSGEAFCQDYDWNHEKRVLKINRIFKWYRKDFDAMSGSIATFLDYAPSDLVAELEGGFKLQYMPYDWQLNTVKQ